MAENTDQLARDFVCYGLEPPTEWERRFVARLKAFLDKVLEPYEFRLAHQEKIIELLMENTVEIGELALKGMGDEES